MNEIGNKVSDVMQLAKLRDYIDKKVDEKSSKLLIGILCAIFAVLAIAGAAVVFLSVFRKKKKKNYAMYDEGFYDFDDGPCYYPGEEMKPKCEKKAKTEEETDHDDKCAEPEKKSVSADKCEGEAEDESSEEPENETELNAAEAEEEE